MNSRNSILSAKVDIEIPFHDCDPMQVVWHGNYPRYMEVARCELLRLFDYDYGQMNDSGYLWPIIDMQIKYVGSARFSQHIEVTAYLKEIENRLKIDYLIKDKATQKTLTKAYTVQVAVDMATEEMQFASPPILHEKLAKVLP
ncbi:acyl-CoA thioesterase [Alteromonas sp. 14N.309.X.WAT.G.H12]|uniref:acyl-CoA thioesterase n=1 Tax=Alteromonas sp. 14N.309.X.WAT.G.H12 TaxID=3120824 RepID=UPI002FD4ECC2